MFVNTKIAPFLTLFWLFFRKIRYLKRLQQSFHAFFDILELDLHFYPSFLSCLSSSFILAFAMSHSTSCLRSSSSSLEKAL